MPKSKRSQLERDVARYCDDVLSGKRLAGRSEIMAIERHRRDLAESKHTDFVFDWRFAERAVDWPKQLTFPRGTAAGKPFNLHITQQVVWSIGFGWRRREDLKRRFRRWFYSKARGNGKSPEAAALATNLFVADVPFQPGAEVVCAATAKRQAKEYVWLPATKFLESIPELSDYLNITQHEATFEVGDTLGKFYALGRDSTNDGGSYHAVVRDELHAMKELHREFCEKLETGLKSDHHLMIDITTAGNDSSVLWIPEYDYAQKILNQVVDDPAYFAYIFEIDEDDDPFTNFDCLKKANPLLDIAIDSETIRAEVIKAKAMPTKRNQVIRYRGNRRTTSDDKAFPPELWARGAYELSDLTGLSCHGGLDLGWRDDLAAFYLVFPVDNPDDPLKPFYEIMGRSWIPRDTPRDLSKPPWPDLIDSGDLIVTDGDVTDDQAIVNYILECNERYDLQSIAADPNNARLMLNQLYNDHGIRTFAFRQTCDKYNEPVNELLDYLAEDRISHGGNGLLAWAADNVVLRENSAGNVMPDKKKAIEKIDPMVAVLMGLSECLFAETENTSSVYDERDMRVLE